MPRRAYHVTSFLRKSAGIGSLLWVGGQETQAGELIDGCVLAQAQFRVGDAAAGNHLHVHLDPLSRISHLLVRFCLVGWFPFWLWEHLKFPHYPEQAFRSAGIARCRSLCHNSTIPSGDFCGAYPGSASVLLLCAGLGGCGAAGTDRPMTLVCHSSVSYRSRCMAGFCYTSG